jgi:hypothetical protein
MHSFGERLKYFRVNILKMKRKAFCDKYDFPVMTIQSWENNGITISKRSMEVLKMKLFADLKDVNIEWIFTGEGDIWQTKNSESKNNVHILNSENSTFTYLIDSFFYEPLLKKNTELTLQPITLRDVNVPSFIAFSDSKNEMHFGIVILTFNKTHILEAYQGQFYKISLHNDDKIFLIKKVVL